MKNIFSSVADFFVSRYLVILAGLAIGLISAFLVSRGNFGNAGIAPTCFICDIAGALGFHSAVGFQYIHPEIPGFIIGSFIAAYVFKEFKSRGGSSPLVRFFLAIFLMVGAQIYLGCPVRTTMRLAGGDLNGLVGIAGLASGAFVGVFFMRKGFTLSRPTQISQGAGWIMPAVMVGLLILLLIQPDFISFSNKGFASVHAAWPLALGGGLIIGFLMQRSRLCFAGAWRDLFLIKNTTLISGVIAAFLGALTLNIILGQFSLGFDNQPLSQTNHVWNFLATTLVGLAATLLTGCPLRQLILSGEGDTDAGVTVLGLFAGTAIMRNFNLSACTGKFPDLGPAAILTALAACLAIGFFMREK
jgi:YedE family putative selenium metabolism protein